MGLNQFSSRWQVLEEHARRLQDISLRGLFDQGGYARSERLRFDHGHLYIDATRQRFDLSALEALWSLAEDLAVLKSRDDMFAGKVLNKTEQRNVSHWAWREPNPSGNSASTLARLDDWVGSLLAKFIQPSGSPIRSILHLGIGGSDLGPRMVADMIAYSNSVHTEIKAYFAANVDGHELQRALDCLDPKTTLVSIASKTFTTRETLCNAQTVIAWLAQGGVSDPLKHVVAVTSDSNKARAWGVYPEQIFEFEDSVGGRFSLWTPVGLPARLAIGELAWANLLKGAYAADLHFKTAPLRENLPLMLALIDIWNHSLLRLPARVIAPYDARMGLWVTYIQQLEMESLGKQLGPNGELLAHAACPMIWGEPGTNGQHAYFQWLHQARQAVAIEVLLVAQPQHAFDAHHNILLANGLAQADAFAFGKQPEGALAAGVNGRLRTLPGGRPVSLWMFRTLDAYTLGYALATLEHKVLCLGQLWGVNAFDQFGVELGKTMALSLEQQLAKGLEGQGDKHLEDVLQWLKNTR